MTGYGGYFLQGMASGMQSGFEMGWKKKQQRELETQQKKVIEEGTILNKAAAEMMGDKIITDDEMVKWNALLLASGKEVQEMSKGWDNAIRDMNAKGCEYYKNMFEMFGENIGNFDLNNFSKSYEEAIKYYPNQKVYFDAANNIIKKKNEAAQTPKEVTPYEFYTGSPASVQSQTAESVAGQTAGLGNVKFNQPNTGTSKISWLNKNKNISGKVGLGIGSSTSGGTSLADNVGQTVSEAQLSEEGKLTGYDEEVEKEVTQEKISAFTDEELYNELMMWKNLRNEAYYQLLYAEAQNRGLK
jgi:hypothetical protein